MTTENLKESLGIKTTGRDPVIAALIQAQSKLANVLPKHITADRMCRLALGDLRLDARLNKAAHDNPQSLVHSIIVASHLGLEIGRAKGHCYLVPFKNRHSGKMEVTPMPGYKGLIHLARQSGEITSIGCHIVYEGDEFEMTLGLNERVIHRPNLNGTRGAARLVYLVAHFRDGAHYFDWMPKHEVDRIRRMSKQPDSGPWAEHEDEMARKTMVRRACKMLPSSSDRLEMAIRASDLADKGEGEPLTIEGEGTFREFDDIGQIGMETETGAGSEAGQQKSNAAGAEGPMTAEEQDKLRGAGTPKK